MTQKENQLLLKDLCARLPYGVKAQYNNKKEIFGDVEQIEASGDIDLSYYDEETERWKLCCTSIDNIKPYLRPMSSMTEEEKKDFGVPFTSEGLVTLADTVECMDWLNKHHFDYHDLIPMGLALEAPKDMYK
jgi:hypothetical protein